MEGVVVDAGGEGIDALAEEVCGVAERHVGWAEIGMGHGLSCWQWWFERYQRMMILLWG